MFCLRGGALFAATCSYSFTETSAGNFGGLQKPASGSQTCQCSYTGCSGCGSGSGTYLYGVQSREAYTITCSSGNQAQTATLTVCDQSAGGTCGAALTQGSFTFRYDNGAVTCTNSAGCSVTLPASGAGSKNLEVGLTATYSSAIAAGTCSRQIGISLGTACSSVNASSTRAITYKFDSPVTATLNNSGINFGTVYNAACTYTINTSGTVTTSSGAPCGYLSGTTAAADITIAGSATQGITISAGSYSADRGVTPSNAKCKYDNGSEGSCSITATAPGSGGKNLKVGVDVAVPSGKTSGTYNPSFTITANYQ